MSVILVLIRTTTRIKNALNLLAKLMVHRRVHQTSGTTWIDRYPATFAAARAALESNKSPVILSYGCSTGEEALTLRRYFSGAKIVGADIDIARVHAARKRNCDPGIHFIYSNPKKIRALGPYDCIFCMAVFQRTPHYIEDHGIHDISDIYPFDKFAREIQFLTDSLCSGGLLILDNYQYLISDTASYAVFEPVEGSPKSIPSCWVFGPDGKRILDPQPVHSIFRKKVGRQPLDV